MITCLSALLGSRPPEWEATGCSYEATPTSNPSPCAGTCGITLWRDASSACLKVLKDLECCLAVGWLETTWQTCFRPYVSGDEQCMRRAKWFPAGSSILTWMRHRDSAFQVGQPAGLRLTCISGPPCSDRLARRPRSQPCRKAGRLRPRQSTAACWSIAELKERPLGRASRRCPHADLRVGFSRSWRRLPQSRPGQVRFGQARQQPAELVVHLVASYRRRVRCRRPVSGNPYP
jgi:hypothetical protein